jgi:iron-sulfur cluster assembly accessory protein
MEGGKMDSVQQENDLEIIITDTALEEMKKFADADNMEYFRVAVTPGGCSGFKYDFSIVDTVDTDDVVLTQSNGLKLIIDPFSSLYLTGTTIGYEHKLEGSGFTFKNPNAKGRCGCGSSFNA